jgi:hypothetical protein
MLTLWQITDIELIVDRREVHIEVRSILAARAEIHRIHGDSASFALNRHVDRVQGAFDLSELIRGSCGPQVSDGVSGFSAVFGADFNRGSESSGRLIRRTRTYSRHRTSGNHLVGAVELSGIMQATPVKPTMTVTTAQASDRDPIVRPSLPD